MYDRDHVFPGQVYYNSISKNYWLIEHVYDHHIRALACDYHGNTEFANPKKQYASLIKEYPLTQWVLYSDVSSVIIVGL